MLDALLLSALIHCESGGKADAISSAGAQGLCQLMPATGREWALRLRLGPYDPFDATQNKAIGSAYLSYLIWRYAGNIELGLAAYNWGMGNIDKALTHSSDWSFNSIRENAPKETRDYVERVLKKYYELAARESIETTSDNSYLGCPVETLPLDKENKK